MTRDDRGKNMEILDWLFIVITAFLCIVSFVLMQYDFRKNPKKSEAKKDTSGTETAALKSTETEPPEEEFEKNTRSPARRLDLEILEQLAY